jgi:ankyrin repeat protein
LDLGCYQDDEQQTPLHYASMCDHPEIIQYLRANNADTSLQDADHQTAHMVAASVAATAAFDC